MHTFLIQFLRSLEEQIPPPDNCHHIICYDKGLAIVVNRRDTFYTFFLEEHDFKSSPEALAFEVALIMTQKT